MSGDVYRTTRERSERVSVAGGELQVTITEVVNGAGEELESKARISISEAHSPHGASISMPTAVLRDLVGKVEL